jgi:hypothetical protein
MSNSPDVQKTHVQVDRDTLERARKCGILWLPGLDSLSTATDEEVIQNAMLHALMLARLPYRGKDKDGRTVYSFFPI